MECYKKKQQKEWGAAILTVCIVSCVHTPSSALVCIHYKLSFSLLVFTYQEHPDAEPMRSAGCPIYRQLCTIFSEPGINGEYKGSDEREILVQNL